MYFPPNFDLVKARQLASLVDQAYIQFEVVKNKKKWEFQGSYDIISEISYRGLQEDILYDTRSFFEKEIRSFLQLTIKSSKKTIAGVQPGLRIGYIARKYNDIYIIFRGTVAATEWLRNLDIGLKPYPDKGMGNVHEGFLTIFISLIGEIEAILRGQPKFRKIFIAGHSLGGALATLLVPLVHRWYPHNPLWVYTYGSPRVGDSEFVEQYNRLFARHTFRIANSSDIVVSVPFPAKFMGWFGGPFTHVDTPVDFTVQLGELEQNHSISNYAEALRAARQRPGIRLWLSRFFNL